jgi:hypothetical protein
MTTIVSSLRWFQVKMPAVYSHTKMPSVRSWLLTTCLILVTGVPLGALQLGHRAAIKCAGCALGLGDCLLELPM